MKRLTQKRSAIAAQAGGVTSVRGRRGLLGRVYTPKDPDAANRAALKMLRARGVNVDRKMNEIRRRQDDESYPS